jgi:hypothetical protein
MHIFLRILRISLRIFVYILCIVLAYFLHIYLRFRHILHIISIFFAYYFAYLAYFAYTRAVGVPCSSLRLRLCENFAA